MNHVGEGAELAAVFERLVRFVRQLTTLGDLSMAAASLLARLVREGPRRLTELADAERVSQPGMTQLVSRLEREGLVRRTATSTDRRGVLVEATEAGVELLHRRRAQRAEALSHLLGQLDPADRAAIVAALPALARLVDTQLADTPTGEPQRNQDDQRGKPA
ncbi:MarR family winged helix-turn-helix transcriptional regulator [Micromonospora sp. HM5-17]|jgi:DNA-binding MarR family transcriptional regulator|uniref:MarR family winged helix-turn-helix transcriptional regulator n=1 Tax=Micromonospora sp. HM5-17 TaxID=2487710 RepID=UPI000F464E74|nr:MarR family transcriptional regulator [Micromonospora sp. HM5-17]ROT28042.1 MarR family transcriptional regulator [Micromonospora sp. HM5-17]